MTRSHDETLRLHEATPAAAETLRLDEAPPAAAETLTLDEATPAATATLPHDETLRLHEATPANATLPDPDQLGGPEPAPTEPGWAPGDVVDDRWEVFGAARGGMGQVYFVRDRVWGNATLAVKSLLAHRDLDAERWTTVRRMFRREAQVWLDLGAHQNIVSGFYTLEVRGALRFFMEYVAGESLADILARGGLDLPRALDLAIQLCAGMQYVHVRDVVHRDLKPANCLVMDDDTLRVTDFGLGKTLGAGDPVESTGEARPADAELSQQGAGTPFYMAPEQWASLAQATKPADVYAFGVILYELFGVGRPFSADPDVLRRYDGRVPPLLQQLIDGAAPIEQLVLRMFHQHAAPFTPVTVRPELPSRLASLAQACLAKRPDERPAFGTLCGELRRAYEEVVGQPYRRQLPDALQPSEAGENNRAVSYYTMGEHEKAKAILDAWLTDDPKALYPWINRQAIAVREAQAEPAEVADRFARELVRSHPDAFRGGDAVGGRARALARYRFEHPAAVLSVAVSPDGATIATGCGDRAVRLFDRSGTTIARYDNLSDVVLALAFCANGDLAAANGTEISIWNRRGSPTTLAGHEALVTSLTVARDGTLWSASNDRTARSWDVSTGRELVRLKKHGEIVRGIAISGDGQHVVTCCFDGQVRLWSSEAQLLRVLSDAGVVQTIARFDADRRALWTGGTDGALRRWDLLTGELVATYRAHTGGLAALAVSSEGLVATAGADQVVRLWDATTGRSVRGLSGHRAAVRALQFVSPTNLVTASDDHTVRLWPLDPPSVDHWPLLIRREAAVGGRRELEVQKRALLERASTGEHVLAQLRAFRDAHDAYRRDEEILTAEHALGRRRGAPTGCRDAFVVWTAATPAPVGAVAFSPVNDAVFAATEAGLWRHPVDRQAPPQRIADVSQVVGCGVTDDGRHVLSAGPSGLAVWAAGDVDRRELDRPWSGRAGALHHAALAGDGSVVVAGGWSRGALRASWQAQGLLRAWRLPDGEERRFKHHGNAVLAVAVSRDGELIAAGMDDGELALWNGDGRRRSNFECHVDGSPITAVAIARTKRFVATGAADGTVRLWRVDTAELVGTAAHHAGKVTSLSISDDEALIASAGTDGTVSLYLCPSLRRLRALEGHSDAAVAAFGPTARQLVTAGRDRLLRVWTLDLDWPA